MYFGAFDANSFPSGDNWNYTINISGCTTYWRILTIHNDFCDFVGHDLGVCPQHTLPKSRDPQVLQKLLTPWPKSWNNCTFKYTALDTVHFSERSTPFFADGPPEEWNDRFTLKA